MYVLVLPSLSPFSYTGFYLLPYGLPLLSFFPDIVGGRLHYEAGGGVQTGIALIATSEHPVPTVGPMNKSLNPFVSGQSCQIDAPSSLVHVKPPLALSMRHESGVSFGGVMLLSSSGSSKWSALTPVSLPSRTAMNPDS